MANNEKSSPSPTPLKQEQLAFLRRVQKHPQKPFATTYKEAELTPVQAKRLLDMLVRNGYVKIREDGLPRGQGRRQPRFLTITDLGKETLKNHRPLTLDAKAPLPLYPSKPMLPLPVSVSPSEPELPPVGTITKAGNNPTCVHHWKTGPADGPKSLGECVHCGSEKVFANSTDYEDPLKGGERGNRRG